MIISYSTTDKHFGSKSNTKDIVITRMSTAISNDYNSSVLHGTDVDGIGFEVRCTDIVASIIETINPYLKNFKLILTMEELPARTTVHRGWL